MKITNANRIGRLKIALNFALAVVGFLSSATLGRADSWTAAPPMLSPRFSHESTLLGSGKVLVTGGIDGFNTSTNSAELYESGNAPIADAGPDFSVNEGQAGVTLNGSLSSPAGNTLTYSWTQVGGTPATTVTLTGDTTSMPTFTAPTVAVGGATLTFKLTVTANNKSSTDTVDVTVVNVNHPPVAHAGDDQSVAEGSPVTLDGAASFDIDNDPFSYTWVQVDLNPPVTLNLTNPAKPTFTAPYFGTSGAPGVVATLVFKLTVNDGYPQDAPAPGYTFANDVDYVTVEISKVNNNPTANAGADQTVNENTGVLLDGTAAVIRTATH